jgi:hypothetical protein
MNAVIEFLLLIPYGCGLIYGYPWVYVPGIVLTSVGGIVWMMSQIEPSGLHPAYENDGAGMALAIPLIAGFIWPVVLFAALIALTGFGIGYLVYKSAQYLGRRARSSNSEMADDVPAPGMQRIRYFEKNE